MNFKSCFLIVLLLLIFFFVREDVVDVIGINEICEGKDENDVGEIINEENVLKEEVDEERLKGKCLNYFIIDEQNKLIVLIFGWLIDKWISFE